MCILLIAGVARLLAITRRSESPLGHRHWILRRAGRSPPCCLHGSAPCITIRRDEVRRLDGKLKTAIGPLSKYFELVPPHTANHQLAYRAQNTDIYDARSAISTAIADDAIELHSKDFKGFLEQSAELNQHHKFFASASEYLKDENDSEGRSDAMLCERSLQRYSQDPGTSSASPPPNAGDGDRWVFPKLTSRCRLSSRPVSRRQAPNGPTESGRRGCSRFACERDRSVRPERCAWRSSADGGVGHPAPLELCGGRAPWSVGGEVAQSSAATRAGPRI